MLQQDFDGLCFWNVMSDCVGKRSDAEADGLQELCQFTRLV